MSPRRKPKQHPRDPLGKKRWRASQAPKSTGGAGKKRPHSGARIHFDYPPEETTERAIKYLEDMPSTRRRRRKRRQRA